MAHSLPVGWPEVKVRIGFGLGTQGLSDPDRRFGELVDGLERCGFDSLWLSERVTGPAPDPLVGLAFAAGRTQRLKFGTSVLVVPGRNPALLAKELASLDVLSGGRMLPAFGLGAPNLREFGVSGPFGVARGERAAWFDEAVPLIRQFWSGEPVTWSGERFTYEGVRVLPRPVQDPFDVWLGGLAPSELRRVGRLGDGWLPSFCTPADAAAGRVVVEAAAEEAGRAIDPEHWGALVVYAADGAEVPARLVEAASVRRPEVDPAELFPVGHGAVAAHLDRFIEVGFSKFVLVPAFEPASWDAELEALAGIVLPLQQR
jgi:probable F420-dependent oxidoreductase